MELAARRLAKELVISPKSAVEGSSRIGSAASQIGSEGLNGIDGADDWVGFAFDDWLGNSDTGEGQDSEDSAS